VARFLSRESQRRSLSSDSLNPRRKEPCGPRSPPLATQGPQGVLHVHPGRRRFRNCPSRNQPTDRSQSLRCHRGSQASRLASVLSESRHGLLRLPDVWRTEQQATRR
jgi:hypothetical protein